MKNGKYFFSHTKNILFNRPKMSNYVVRIKGGLFKSSLQRSAAPIFSKAINFFEILSHEKWVFWGPGKSKFMDVIGNKYLCEPPLSLSYGQTKGCLPKVEVVKFQGVMPTAHLSARYEFFKDEFDQTCEKFIKDNSVGSNEVEYDVKKSDRVIDMDLYRFLLKELKLEDLEKRWAMGLSNGQMRRARLARSLLKEPDILLVDDLFLGLDPSAAKIISEFMRDYSRSSIVIGLLLQDHIPEWCTHICCVNEDGILFQGKRDSVEHHLKEVGNQYYSKQQGISASQSTIDDLISTHALYNIPHTRISQMPHSFELRGLNVSYRGEDVIKDLYWKIPPGSKWHIRGDNGTGKSTLLSLLTADHPQSWNSRLVENGVPRRTGSTNYFEINRKIGMSSPELHATILNRSGKRLNLVETIATGFHEGTNNFTPCFDKLSYFQKELIMKYVKFFGLSHISGITKLEDLSVSDQKLVLFIRSIIKMPEILILDEAFSAMETELMRKCHALLEKWPGTVLVVSHIDEETPRCDNFIKLISPGDYKVGNV